MIASAKRRPRRLSTRVLHAAFLAMLPDIRRHAAIAFSDLDSEAKAEAVQEVTANAFAAFHRLAELGKADVAYPSVLAMLDSLSSRDRRIAEELATGETTGAVAFKFRVSAGRVSQLRRELKQSWDEFHGQTRSRGLRAA